MTLELQDLTELAPRVAEVVDLWEADREKAHSLRDELLVAVIKRIDTLLVSNPPADPSVLLGYCRGAAALFEFDGWCA